MKTFKKIFGAVVIIALAALVAFAILDGTGKFQDSKDIEGVSIETTRQEPELLTFEPSETNVRPVGRTVFENGVRWVSMSGSGVEFNCLADYLDITLKVENPSYIPQNHRPRVAVIANGDDVLFDETLGEEETTAHIDLSSYDEDTKISVIKLSESMYSAFGIGSIKAYCQKDITPTEEKQLKIEFIGDSITAGYGIDEEAERATFSTATENFTETYAYQTAMKLDAQYSAVAFSGYGVLTGSSSAYYANYDKVISKVYDKAITNKTFDGDETLTDWNFASFCPNFVVINLGANDSVYCSTEQRRSAFKEEYVNLLKTVRENNPDAYILCILGDMNSSLYLSIEQAVEQYSSENADSKVSASSITFNMEENGTVIDGHPGKKANQVAANELSQLITSINSKLSANQDETSSVDEGTTNDALANESLEQSDTSFASSESETSAE